MRFRWTFRQSGVGLVVAFLSIATSAQGGWRQWEIHFRDGTTVEASPLQMRADGRFTRSMDPKEPGFERSRIGFIAAARSGLPPLPKGNFLKDAVILLDGTRIDGAIAFRKIQFSEGTFVQSGKEMTLEKVAYIIFAAPRRPPPAQKKKT